MFTYKKNLLYQEFLDNVGTWLEVNTRTTTVALRPHII